MLLCEGGTGPAIEVCNALDDDGDGDTDCEDLECSSLVTCGGGLFENCGNSMDDDQDGYAENDDCDDNDGAVYPGAPEAWYDGVDGDCAGDDDFDQDKDGSGVELDCDDTTALAFPVPIPGPGVDPAPVTIATFPSTRPVRSVI